MADLNDVRLAKYLANDTKQHYDASLSKQTAFTWVQRTIGSGFRLIAVRFDVQFSAEPMFAPGAALVSVTAAGYMPYTQALVMNWTRDPKNGMYLGASVAVAVELRFTPGFLPGSHASSGSDAPTATVAHHLTFSGPATSLTPRTRSTPKKTGMNP